MHDKDEFITYNCSQQMDNVNNTHLFLMLICLDVDFLNTELQVKVL